MLFFKVLSNKHQKLPLKSCYYFDVLKEVVAFLESVTALSFAVMGFFTSLSSQEPFPFLVFALEMPNSRPDLAKHIKNSHVAFL